MFRRYAELLMWMITGSSLAILLNKPTITQGICFAIIALATVVTTTYWKDLKQ